MSNEKTNKLFGYVFVVVLVLLFWLCIYEALQTNRRGNEDPGILIDQAQRESQVIQQGITEAEKRVDRIEAGAESLEKINRDSGRIIEECQRILREAKARGTTED